MKTKISVLGIDIGKNLCSLVGLDASGASFTPSREEGNARWFGGAVVALSCRDGSVLRRASSWPAIRDAWSRGTTDVSRICSPVCQGAKER